MRYVPLGVHRRALNRYPVIMRLRYLLVIAVFLVTVPLSAQQDSLWHGARTLVLRDVDAAAGDTLLASDRTLLAHTVAIQADQKTLPASFYRVMGATVIWRKPIQARLLSVTYRTLSFDLSQREFNKDTTWRSPRIDGRVIQKYDFGLSANARSESSTASQLQYQGTYARGIAFGNNQDATFNSTFNLQLSGDLGDGIQIAAAITDNNIPIQPQGNTQQLQDFDQVYIQVKRDKTQLTAGDYELRRPTGYFMNYFKKLQGATLQHGWTDDDGRALTTQASFAIARGKFARNAFIGIEGNQGPYRLRGDAGETFIIVLAGTERVFIDGQLLQRGQTADYIIDYNRGEITFTPNQLITKDKRIIVEFEYNDQRYNRTLLAFNQVYDHSPRLQLYLNAYSQRDGKSPTSAQPFTPQQQAVLRTIPDDLGIGLAPGVDSAGFLPDRVQYTLIDTVVGSMRYDSVLVYSTDPTRMLYNVQFSEVGLGNGDYIRLPAAANGTVFGWVAPDPLTGQRRGSYAPVIQLTTPVSQQLTTAGGVYRWGQSGELRAEGAWSHLDRNRFGDINADRNHGAAAKLTYRATHTLRDTLWTLAAEADYEATSRHFQALNPFRGREFARDWNIATQSGIAQHIGTSRLALRRMSVGEASYAYQFLSMEGAYWGSRHLARLRVDRGGWLIDATANTVLSRTATENAIFARPKILAQKQFKWGKTEEPSLLVGVYGERERNARRSSTADTLSAQSFYYDLLRAFAEWEQSQHLRVSTQYQRRYDYSPQGQDFATYTIADEVNLKGEYALNRAQRLTLNLTYRDLQVRPLHGDSLSPQSTYLGRIDYRLTAPKGWLRYQANYQIGSGQEQRVQYTYLPVDAGQGVYTWIDRNLDGIKQLDEFEVAVFQDQADHIRVITFTDEYIRTNEVQFNQSLMVQPRAIWRKPKKDFQKVLNRFSLQSNWQINRKVRQLPDVSAWNPFQLQVADTALVSVSSNVRNSLYFNRTRQTFRAEIGMLNNQSRVVLTTGYEDRRRAEQFAETKWNFARPLTWETEVRVGRRRNDSEFFEARDYDLSYLVLRPSLVLQVQSQWRARVEYAYDASQNTLPDAPAAATQHEWAAEVNYRSTGGTALEGRFSYVGVDYTGTAGTALQFAMLEGLQNGQNYRWTLTYRRTLFKNLELNLTYQGRKTGALRVIHTGNASMRALF